MPVRIYINTLMYIRIEILHMYPNKYSNDKTRLESASIACEPLFGTTNDF